MHARRREDITVTTHIAPSATRDELAATAKTYLAEIRRITEENETLRIKLTRAENQNHNLQIKLRNAEDHCAILAARAEALHDDTL